MVVNNFFFSFFFFSSLSQSLRVCLSLLYLHLATFHFNALQCRCLFFSHLELVCFSLFNVKRLTPFFPNKQLIFDAWPITHSSLLARWLFYTQFWCRLFVCLRLNDRNYWHYPLIFDVFFYFLLFRSPRNAILMKLYIFGR